MEYAFARLDAVRSFREAWKRDPECAICYWGEGWAWGSYLNGPMSADQSPFAYAAMQKALSLKDAHATPVERAFIEALSVRYVKNFDVKTRVEQDRAYAEAMRKVADAYPDDLDASTLYADALFLLEPRRGTRDVHAPNIQRLHAVLERVLDKDPRHPGACHLYVHATESTVTPEKAGVCAAFLGNSIPGASHINHMPSHTWNEVGRWSDSVRANIEAWHSDLKADIGKGFAPSDPNVRSRRPRGILRRATRSSSLAKWISPRCIWRGCGTPPTRRSRNFATIPPSNSLAC